MLFRLIGYQLVSSGCFRQFLRTDEIQSTFASQCGDRLKQPFVTWSGEPLDMFHLRHDNDFEANSASPRSIAVDARDRRRYQYRTFPSIQLARNFSD